MSYVCLFQRCPRWYRQYGTSCCPPQCAVSASSPEGLSSPLGSSHGVLMPPLSLMVASPSPSMMGQGLFWRSMRRMLWEQWHYMGMWLRFHSNTEIYNWKMTMSSIVICKAHMLQNSLPCLWIQLKLTLTNVCSPNFWLNWLFPQLDKVLGPDKMSNDCFVSSGFIMGPKPEKHKWVNPQVAQK